MHWRIRAVALGLLPLLWAEDGLWGGLDACHGGRIPRPAWLFPSLWAGDLLWDQVVVAIVLQVPRRLGALVVAREVAGGSLAVTWLVCLRGIDGGCEARSHRISSALASDSAPSLMNASSSSR
eukprot:16443972-Heterocapsa_arctica.AAC.2